MARVLTQAQRDSLAAGRAKANENRRREKARRETGLDVETEQLAAPPLSETPPEQPADSAPRQRAGAGRAAAPASRTPSLAKIRAGLVSLFTMTGVGLSMVDAYDGQVVAMNAGRLADSWADLAAQDPRVRRALEALLAGSAWGTAITTTAMVALPIAAHHRLAPPEVAAMAAQAGVVVPTLGMETEPAEVRVERQPRRAEPSPGDPTVNGHAASQAPPETAGMTPEDAVAAWAGGSDVPPVDAGGVDFPPRPPAPPSG